jgi:hypothetical protein
MHSRPLARLFVLLASIGLLVFSAAAQTPDPVGEWNLKTDAQGQTTNFTLTITKQGEVLKGKVASEQYGSQDLTDLKYENGTLTYTRNLDLGGQAISMLFKGKIEGDKLTGAYTVEGLDLPVTGSRKSATPATTPPAATPAK